MSQRREQIEAAVATFYASQNNHRPSPEPTRVNHAPHESLTGKGRKPSDTPTPRELDFVRALDGIQRANRDVTMAGLAAWLGVQIPTAIWLRDRCVERGVVHSSGFGSSRRLTITDFGRHAVGEG